MRHFDDQLQELLNTVATMGELAESMVRTAVKALVSRDESLTLEVFAREREVNSLQVAVDDQAIRLTVLQQPVARDARFLFMASRIGGELERIADQAINICQNTHYVLQSPPLQPLVGLPVMADVAVKMVRDGVAAMMRRDVALANTVLEEEEKVDAHRDQIFRVLLTHMMSDPTTIQRALSLILIARNLERVGDHATNIAEEVIYWVQGRDVRHNAGGRAVRRAPATPGATPSPSGSRPGGSGG
jgi:phosphate transport system protein